MVDNKIIMGLLTIFVLVIAGCSNDYQQDNSGFQEQEDNFPEQNDGFETPGITGNVVATVNNEEITSEEVQEIQQIFAQQGQQVDEEQSIEQLISEKLLLSEVKNKGYELSLEETQQLIEQQLSMQGMSIEDYKEQLNQLGSSYETELSNLQEQFSIQNYIDSQVGTDFNVSEQEVEQFYQQYSAQSQEEIPPKEELEVQIVESIKQQKQQEAISLLLEQLKQDAEIVYN